MMLIFPFPAKIIAIRKHCLMSKVKLLLGYESPPDTECDGNSYKEDKTES